MYEFVGAICPNGVGQLGIRSRPLLAPWCGHAGRAGSGQGLMRMASRVCPGSAAAKQQRLQHRGR